MTFCKLFKLSSNDPSPISKKRKSRDNTRCDDCHTNTYSMCNWGWGFNTASNIVLLGPLGKGATKQGIYVTSFASNFRKVRTGVTFAWRRYFWRKVFSKTPGWSGYRVGENTTPGMALTLPRIRYWSYIYFLFTNDLFQGHIPLFNEQNVAVSLAV